MILKFIPDIGSADLIFGIFVFIGEAVRQKMSSDVEKITFISCYKFSIM